MWEYLYSVTVNYNLDIHVNILKVIYLMDGDSAEYRISMYNVGLFILRGGVKIFTEQAVQSFVII